MVHVWTSFWMKTLYKESGSHSHQNVVSHENCKWVGFVVRAHWWLGSCHCVTCHQLTSSNLVSLYNVPFKYIWCFYLVCNVYAPFPERWLFLTMSFIIISFSLNWALVGNCAGKAPGWVICDCTRVYHVHPKLIQGWVTTTGCYSDCIVWLIESL